MTDTAPLGLPQARQQKLSAYLDVLPKDVISGWLLPGAAWTAFLVADWQWRNQVRGHIGEIGVHHGKFAILLSLLRGPGDKLVVVDVFGEQHFNVDGSGRGDKAIFLDNFRAFDGDTDGLLLHERDSLSLLGRDLLSPEANPIGWDGKQPDLIRIFSVDGSHTSLHTWNDILIAAQQLAPYGVIIVDDFYNSDWPGVQEGVHRLLASRPDLKPVMYGDNKLYLCRADDHPSLYKAFEREIAQHAKRCRVVQMHGVDALSIVMDDEPLVLADRFGAALAKGDAVILPMVKPKRRWALFSR